MKINHDTPIEAIRELGDNTGASGNDEYPVEAARLLKSYLVGDEHTDTGLIPERILGILAVQAMNESRRRTRLGPEADVSGRNDQDATPQYELFTQVR